MDLFATLGLGRQLFQVLGVDQSMALGADEQPRGKLGAALRT